MTLAKDPLFEGALGADKGNMSMDEMSDSDRNTSRRVNVCRNEGGQTLVLALVVMLALTLSSAGVIGYMTSNQNSFSRDSQENRALDIAEAGLQQGIATVTQWDPQLNRLRYPDSTGSLPSTSYSFDGGNGTFSAIKTKAYKSGDTTDVWTVTATATYGKVTRTVTQQTYATASTTPPSPVYGYGLYVAGDAGGCTTVSGSISIQANIWIGNDFCPGGNTTVTSPADNTLTMYVGGAFRGGNNVTIGSAANRLKQASIVKGCYNGSSSVVCSNNSGQQKTQSGVFAVPGGYNSQSQTLVKPTVDPASIYANGNWTSPTCVSGSGYQSFTFEPNATRSNNPTNTVTLDQNKSYDCTVSGTGGGHIAYNASTKTLTVTGAIFIDGNLNVYNNINYSAGSNGTIYINGTVDAKGDICGPPTTASGNNCVGGTWNPTVSTGGGQIEIVAMNVGSCPPNHTPGCDSNSQGWKVSGSGELDIFTFVVGQINSTGNGSSGNFKGPIIANAASLNGGGGISYTGNPPDQAPGGSTVISTWGVVPSSWRQIPN